MNQQTETGGFTMNHLKVICDEKDALEAQLREAKEALIQASETFRKIRNAVTDNEVGWRVGCELAKDWADLGMNQKVIAEVGRDYHEWRKWQTTCVCGGCFKANADLMEQYLTLKKAAIAVYDALSLDNVTTCNEFVALAEAAGIEIDDLPRSQT